MLCQYGLFNRRTVYQIGYADQCGQGQWGEVVLSLRFQSRRYASPFNVVFSRIHLNLLISMLRSSFRE